MDRVYESPVLDRMEVLVEDGVAASYGIDELIEDEPF